MPPENNIEKRLQELGQAVGGDDSLTEAVMARIRAGQVAPSDEDPGSGIRFVIRRLVTNRSVRFAAAAAVVLAILGGISFLGRFGPKAYAIEQTIRAMRNVRYMHVVKHDKAGNLEDERWEEIGPDGYQARYRQNTPMDDFYAVDDRRTVMAYYASKDKNTVVLHDPNQESYTWYNPPTMLFEELAEGEPNYYTIEENVQYKGKPAHHLRSLITDEDIYIDPQTKLPMALGKYEVSYEEPPEGTFDIVIPDGSVVVDRRPGAKPTPLPRWMPQDELRQVARAYFTIARRAMAAEDYATAIEFFTKGLELSPKSNWSWLWMGRAQYKAGDYDGAIRTLTKAIDVADISSCNLARGMAYQAKGMTDEARMDFEKALPAMIKGLRVAEKAYQFDLADDPLIPADEFPANEAHRQPNRQQSQAMMINRLRLITGQDFGYDPNAGDEEKERVIAAWEQWFKTAGHPRSSK